MRFSEAGAPTTQKEQDIQIEELTFLSESARLVLYASGKLPPTRAEQDLLQTISALPGVEKVVGLPDLHLKPHLETPSSTAIATEDAVVLNFSSPSPGCGMALVNTGLTENDLTPEGMDELFSHLATHLPGYSPQRVSPVRDIRPFLLNGAQAAVEHYDLGEQVLSAMDGRGNALTWSDMQAGEAEILRSVPEALLNTAARDFGMIGRGNHFLELQVVEDILDGETAKAWGIESGQVMVMYHADSGKFGAFLGRLYAHRRKNNLRGRLVELRLKIPYHLLSNLSHQERIRRLNAYFIPRRFTFIPSRSPEARLALLALAVGMNYAFANRLAILSTLQEGLHKVWGQEKEAVRLINDQPHNTIRQEEIGGKDLWIHRHNATRVLPAGHADLKGSPYFETGQPVLLPGTDRTHSFLGLALPGVSDSLNSVDHGAGLSATRLGTGLTKALEGPLPHTRLYGFDGKPGQLKPHLGDEGVEEVLSVLGQANLVRPVARLRPVAVLKESSR